MLRMYVKEYPKKGEDYLHLVEFAYNNYYQASTKLSLFEILYGRKCNTLITMSNLVDRLMLGLDLLKELELIVKQVQRNFKASQDIQKRYVDLERTPKEFQVGEHVFIKVRPKKSSLRLGSCAKLAPRYCGPFEILSRVGQVAYQLALPPNLKVHNVFHISVLKKYVHDATHVIDWNVVQVEPEGKILVEPDCILGRREITLRNRTIGQLMVQWKHLSPEEATWKLESKMREAYPNLFQETAEDEE